MTLTHEYHTFYLFFLTGFYRRGRSGKTPHHLQIFLVVWYLVRECEVWHFKRCVLAPGIRELWGEFFSVLAKYGLIWLHLRVENG